MSSNRPKGSHPKFAREGPQENWYRVRFSGKNKKSLLDKERILGRNEAPDAWGIILMILPKVPAASEAFSPEELEERIEAHSRRVKSEEERLANGLTHAKDYSKAGVKKIPEWVRVVNCGVCKRLLVCRDQPEVLACPHDRIQTRWLKELRVLVKRFGTPACVAPVGGHDARLCEGCARERGIQVPTREPQQRES